MTDLTTKIDEAGKLDAKIKEMTTRLKGLKLELAANFEAHGVKKELGNKFQVSFSITPKFSDINPVECHTILDNKGLGDKLLDVVKIQVTPLKKFLSGDEVDSLRTKTGQVTNVKLELQKKK